MAGTPASAQKLLPSSTNGLGPRGRAWPPTRWYAARKASTAEWAGSKVEGIADELIIAGDGCLGVVRQAIKERSAELSFSTWLGASVPGRPAARPLEPALLRVLVEDLAAMELPDEGAGGAADRGRSGPDSSRSSRPNVEATSSAPAAMTLGSSRGRKTSWTGRVAPDP